MCIQSDQATFASGLVARLSPILKYIHMSLRITLPSPLSCEVFLGDLRCEERRYILLELEVPTSTTSEISATTYEFSVTYPYVGSDPVSMDLHLMIGKE